jgi:hypothetical protein
LRLLPLTLLLLLKLLQPLGLPLRLAWLELLELLELLEQPLLYLEEELEVRGDCLRLEHP